MVTKVFRVHLNFLNGAILALLFPVTNARLVGLSLTLYFCFAFTLTSLFDFALQLPFETETYYIQHIAMLMVPYYLLRLGGKDR